MPAPEVTVIDYGVGNLLSVRRALEYHGAQVVVTSDPNEIRCASRLVLPGVGAFSTAMQLLQEKSIIDAIREAARNATPVLGICLGMQLLFDESIEFGRTKGIGLITGEVLPLPRQSIGGARLKSPNIGWHALVPVRNANEWRGTILDSVNVGDAVYFLHSFAVTTENEADRLADSVYGGHRIASVVEHGNVMGCQFHPEKSGKVGLNILAQFLKMNPAGVMAQ